MARDDGFYLRPSSRGYCNMVVGIHTLEKTIPSMMKEAGIIGKFTLHSLRATCATRLYERGVDEQVIQEVTGHSSLAVRGYKRTSDQMKANVSSILQGNNVVTEKEKSWIVCSQAVQNVVVVDHSVESKEEILPSPSKKLKVDGVAISNCTFSNCSFSF